MNKLSIFITLCLLVLVGLVSSCSDSPQEATAKKAMECLKNTDADGYTATLLDNNGMRAKNIVNTLKRRHNGISKYTLKDVSPSPYAEGYWDVVFEITDGNNKVFNGSVIVCQDEQGNFKVSDVEDWFR